MLITAISDFDYINISSTQIFISGSTGNDVRCLDITIVEDSALEGNQTFAVTLSSSDPDVMLENDITTITIIDNDGL